MLSPRQSLGTKGERRKEKGESKKTKVPLKIKDKSKKTKVPLKIKDKSKKTKGNAIGIFGRWNQVFF